MWLKIKMAKTKTRYQRDKSNDNEFMKCETYLMKVVAGLFVIWFEFLKHFLWLVFALLLSCKDVDLYEW